MPKDPIGGVIRNLLTMQRLGTGLSREAQAMVRDLIDDIAAQVARIDPTAPKRGRYRRERLAKLVGEIESMTGKRYREIQSMLRSRLTEIGVQQAGEAERQLERALGTVAAEITTQRVGPQLMRSILDSEPFDGFLLKEWTRKAGASTASRVHRQVQLGMAQNETLDDIIRRIRGRSVGGRFVGGVMRTSTRDAEAVARTAVNFIANRGHVATYQANADILASLTFTATLDSRTTEICAALDGRTTDAADPDPDMIPPRHFQCRSVLVPNVDWEGLGIEPPPEGERASADGPVPASQTYEGWLRDQPMSTKVEVLGRSKAKLFDAGEIGLRDLITKDQRVLTVAEIESR